MHNCAFMHNCYSNRAYMHGYCSMCICYYINFRLHLIFSLFSFKIVFFFLIKKVMLDMMSIVHSTTVVYLQRTLPPHSCLTIIAQLKRGQRWKDENPYVKMCGFLRCVIHDNQPTISRHGYKLRDSLLPSML